MSTLSPPETRSSNDVEKEKLEDAHTDIDTRSDSVKVDPETLHDPAFVKHTMRKVDWRLIPILGALYSLSLIDRTNISIARITGTQEDLAIEVPPRFSVIALVFFVGYIILELPANLVLRKVGAKLWLSSIAVAWGTVMIGMGFAQNWVTLAVLRALLGCFEAGFFPACVYLISTFYIRREVQKRLAFFYLFSALVGGFSNILAYGLTSIRAAGYRGWRWLFIIEGIMTVVAGFIAYFVIVDFPDKNDFLTPEETKLVCDRVEYDRADSVPDPMTWAKFWTYCADLKLWGFALLFMCSTMPAYAFAYFLPIILRGMGFNVRDSQLLSAPPAVFAVLLALTVSWYADKVNLRGPFLVLQATITITGLAMTAYHPAPGVRYAGCFLGFAGAQGNIPTVLAWQSNNIRTQSKRAFSSALVVGFGGIGGIFASVAYREQDRPTYRPGLWATIACQLLIITIVAVNSLWFTYRNRQAQRGGKLVEGLHGFRYTL